MKGQYRLKQFLLNTFIGTLYGRTIGKLKRRSNQLRVATGSSSLDFLNALTQQNINYALIRWSEDIEQARDIDIIISDDDLGRLYAICSSGLFAFGKPVDAFSVNGAKGHNFKTIAYFPPYLAQRMLQQCVEIDGIRKLKPEDEFFALLYHVLFHKNVFSNLTDNFLAIISSKYSVRLLNLSKIVECELEGKCVLDVFELLVSEGWETPFDAINKLSSDFRIVKQYRDLKIQEIGQVANESCLILREGFSIIEFQAILIEVETKFDVVLDFRSELTENQIEVVKLKFRGGNWSNLGKHREEGEGPIFIQFLRAAENAATDVHSATHQAKTYIRSRIGGNFVHSTDDKYEAAQLRKILKI